MSKERDIVQELAAFNAKLTPSGLMASNKTSNPLDNLVIQYYKGAAASNRAAYIDMVLKSFGKADEANLASDKFTALPEGSKNVIRTIANRRLNFKNSNMNVNTINTILKMQMVDSMLSSTGTSVQGFINIDDPNMSDMSAEQIASALHALGSWSYVENLRSSFVNETISDVLYMLNYLHGSKNKKAFDTLLTVFEIACGYFELADTVKMLTDHIGLEILNTRHNSVSYSYENPFEGEEYEEDLTMTDMENMKEEIFHHVSKLGNANLINPKALNFILANSTTGELKDMNSIKNNYDRVMVPAHYRNITPIMAHMNTNDAIDKNPANQLLLLYIASVGCRLRKQENSPKGVLATYKTIVNKPIEVSNFEVNFTNLLRLDLDVFKNKRFTYAWALSHKDQMLLAFSVKFLTHIRGVSPLNRAELVSRSGQKPVSMTVVRSFMKDNDFIESDNDDKNSLLYQSIANWANRK